MSNTAIRHTLTAEYINSCTVFGVVAVVELEEVFLKEPACISVRVSMSNNPEFKMSLLNSFCTSPRVWLMLS